MEAQMESYKMTLLPQKYKTVLKKLFQAQKVIIDIQIHNDENEVNKIQDKKINDSLYEIEGKISDTISEFMDRFGLTDEDLLVTPYYTH